MRPPAEQLIRDYLNRLSVAARNRLKPEDRRAFLARTGDFIERQSGVRGTADPAEVMRILSGIGEPETVVERERVRLETQRSERAAAASRVTLWKPRRESAPQVQPDAGQLTNKDGRPLTGEIRVTSRPITSRWKPGVPLKPREDQTAQPPPSAGRTGRSGRVSWIPRPRRSGSAPPPPAETGPEASGPQVTERPSAPAPSAPAGPGPVSAGPGGVSPGGPAGAAPVGSDAQGSGGAAGSRVPASGGAVSAGSRAPASGGTTAADPGSDTSAGKAGSGGAASAGSGAPASAGSGSAAGAGQGGGAPAGSGGAMSAGARNGGAASSNGAGPVHQVPAAPSAPPARPARPLSPPAAGSGAGPLTPERGNAATDPRFSGRTLRIGLPGRTVRIGRLARPTRSTRGRATRSAALPPPRRRLQPGDVTLVIARRAADTGRRHRTEAACVVLMIVAGLIYPAPLWLVGFLIWLVAAAVTTTSTVWSLPDKWIGIVGPVALVIIGTATLVSLGGTLVTFHDYVHEALADSVWLIKIGGVLGGGFLAWRLQRGRRPPAVPPWIRRNRQ